MMGGKGQAKMEFQRDGLLPPGVHEITGKRFIEEFCKGEKRAPFAKAIQDVCDYSSRGATRILVGGSFVSQVAAPNDLDCVIVFERENQIPERSEQLEIEGTKLDIFFCSEDQPDLLGAFVKLFGETRRERTTGIIQISLWEGGKPLWQVIQEPDENTLEIIKRVYFHRHIVDFNGRQKAVITIHGIESHGEWNAEVAHIVSSNGWIIAPFIYGYVDASVFLNPPKGAKLWTNFARILKT